MRIFKEFDRDGDGYISKHELHSLLVRFDDDVTDDELDEMMRVADKDGDGAVSLEEFITVMSTSDLMQKRITDNLLSPCGRSNSRMAAKDAIKSSNDNNKSPGRSCRTQKEERHKERLSCIKDVLTSSHQPIREGDSGSKRVSEKTGSNSNSTKNKNSPRKSVNFSENNNKFGNGRANLDCITRSPAIAITSHQGGTTKDKGGFPLINKDTLQSKARCHNWLENHN